MVKRRKRKQKSCNDFKELAIQAIIQLIVGILLILLERVISQYSEKSSPLLLTTSFHRRKKMNIIILGISYICGLIGRHIYVYIRDKKDEEQERTE